MSASKMSTPKAASLLGLPRELRDEIWTLSLVPQPTNFSQRAYTPGARPISGAPTLLHTCQQIRREASEVFYKQTFEISLDHDGRKLERSKDWIRVHAPAMPVKSVRVMIAGPRSKTWFDSANLSELEGRTIVRHVGVRFEFVLYAYTADNLKERMKAYVEERRNAMK